ncbi:PAS domain-containing sensor histidine kinase [Sabulicella glaciei]|uniref:histidine kinase n=1 Tax=Sabulicella glaciei TaxID=2984948 RepID=A0ABT3NWI4_9PROT|nr:PAS domain-containing sensor histidine kinase [Roseococcus sp. MDT2-1-1]MCW8086523.1 ATP-binding protein [Roseococcus sp. MDT2-1-1]
MLTLGGFTVIELAGRLRASQQERLHVAAGAARHVVERELEGAVLVLLTLAGSPQLDDPRTDLQDFHPRAALAAELLGTWVVLHDEEPGRQLLDTRYPANAAMPPAPPDEPARQAMATGRPAIAPLGQGRETVSVAVPILREGRAIGALSAPLDMLRLVQLLEEQQKASPGLTLFVLDSAMRQIAATSAEPLLDAAAMGVIAAQGDRIARVPGPAGTVVVAFNHTEGGGWIVGAAEVEARFVASWREPALRLLVTAGLLLLVGFLIVSWQARRLARPLARLAAGEEWERSGARVQEFEELEDAVRSMQEALRREAANADRAAAANLQLARDAEDDRRLLSSVMHSMPDSVFVKDLALRYVLINEAGAAMIGRPIEEVIGSSDADLFAPAVAAEMSRVDRLVMDADLAREQEERIERLDGVETWFMSVKAPWRDSSGEMAGLIGVARDVTERKATERRLANAEAAMRRIARADSMAAMSVGLAHELNQPLTAASNYLRAARRLADGNAPDPARLQMAREAMGEAADQVIRAGAIIQRLRDFIGRGETERRRVDMSGMALESVTLARAARGPGSAPVPVVMDGRNHTVMGDPVQLQQVTVNLLRNALEATEGEPEPRVILRLSRAEGEVRLEVEDNGPGISPEVMERLFEPFQSTKADGMGIGLSICRAIVEAHHGRLEALPADGGGTIMRVSLAEVT